MSGCVPPVQTASQSLCSVSVDARVHTFLRSVFSSSAGFLHILLKLGHVCIRRRSNTWPISSPWHHHTADVTTSAQHTSSRGINVVVCRPGRPGSDRAISLSSAVITIDISRVSCTYPHTHEHPGVALQCLIVGWRLHTRPSHDNMSTLELPPCSSRANLHHKRPCWQTYLPL
jgi:hypothetical protein